MKSYSQESFVKDTALLAKTEQRYKRTLTEEKGKIHNQFNEYINDTVLLQKTTNRYKQLFQKEKDRFRNQFNKHLNDTAFLQKTKGHYKQVLKNEKGRFQNQFKGYLKDTILLQTTKHHYKQLLKNERVRFQNQFKVYLKDTMLLQRTKDHYKQVLKKEKGKIQNQVTCYLNRIKSVFTDPANRKISVIGKLQTEGEYVNNSYAPSASNGFYYRAGINATVTIGKLPFTAGVTLNFKDQKVLLNYTQFNFNFDSKKYTDELKSSYLSYLGDINNFYSPEVAGQVLNYKDSLNKWQSLKTELSGKEYYSKLQNFSKELKPLQESLMKTTLDSTQYKKYQSINDSIKLYKNKSNEYSNLDKYKSQNKGLQKQLEEYEGYKDKVKKTDNVLAQPEMKEGMKKAKILDKTGSVFSGIQKLGIGRTVLNLSDFTIRNRTIFGFDFAYLIKNIYYVGVGFGSISPSNYQFSPTVSFQQTMPSFSTPKLIGYLRFGIGAANDNHLHIIYTSYGEKFTAQNATGLPNVPPANSVLALVFKQKIDKNFSFDGEFATSNSNFIDRAATFAPFEIKQSNSKFNFAAKGVFTGKIEKSSTSFIARVNVVSDNFNSAGNMFSRKDYLESGVNINQLLLEGKLNFSSMFNYNMSGLISGTNKQSFFTSSNSVSAIPFSHGRYTFTYTTVKQFSTARGGGMSTHMINLQQQYTYSIKKIQLSTLLSTNYSISDLTYSEQHSKTHQIQNSLQEIISFPKSVRLLIGGGLTFTKSNTIPNQYYYWVETGNSFSIKSKATLGYSVKYLRDNIGTNNVFVNANLNTEIGKGFSAILRGQVQMATGLQQRLNISVSAGLSYNFQFSFQVKKSKQVATNMSPKY